MIYTSKKVKAQQSLSMLFCKIHFIYNVFGYILGNATLIFKRKRLVDSSKPKLKLELELKPDWITI